MATPNVAILTNNGRTLFNKAVSGQIKIQYTKLVFSSDDLSDDSDEDLQSLDDLNNKEVVTTPVAFYAPFQNNGQTYYQSTIRGIGNNKDLQNGFHVRAYGLYASDGQNEILYGVTYDNNPGYIAPFDGKSPQYFSYGWHFELTPGEAGNFKFDPASAVYPTIEELKNCMQQFNESVHQTFETKADAKIAYNSLSSETSSTATSLGSTFASSLSSTGSSAVSVATNQNGQTQTQLKNFQTNTQNQFKNTPQNSDMKGIFNQTENDLNNTKTDLQNQINQNKSDILYKYKGVTRDNLNNIIDTGLYSINNVNPNNPGDGSLIKVFNDGDRGTFDGTIFQIVLSENGPIYYRHSFYDTHKFSNWSNLV